MACPTKRTLVIGIDFGTTFSGVSWLFCVPGRLPDQPQIVRKWPSQFAKNNEQGKVPPAVYYDKDTGGMSWGYNIPSDVKPLQWLKLLILKHSDWPGDHAQSTRLVTTMAMLDDLNKTAVEVIADYLREIWTHSLDAIKRAKGRNLVEATPIHVVLTVPAIWKEYARDEMRKAVDEAGILRNRLGGPTTLELISEPEAAALSTIPELGDQGDLAVDDSFVVCDCGGGTVDIISYLVGKTEPLTVKECVEGDGALCGGVFPDAGFEEFMKKAVGASRWRRMQPTVVKKMINGDWEHGIKPEFDGTDLRWFVGIPNDTRTHVQPNTYVSLPILRYELKLTAGKTALISRKCSTTALRAPPDLSGTKLQPSRKRPAGLPR